MQVPLSLVTANTDIVSNVLKEVSKETFIYLLIRAGKCTASHVAGVQGNSVFFGRTVIIKTQFEKRTLIVKSPVTELLFL